MTVQKTADIDLSGEIICATEYVDGEDRWIVLTVEHDDPILGTRIMSEKMPEERLAELRTAQRREYNRMVAEIDPPTWEYDAFNDMLAEIDRLHAELAAKEAEIERLRNRRITPGPWSVTDYYQVWGGLNPEPAPCHCTPGDQCSCAYDCDCRERYAHFYADDRGWLATNTRGPAPEPASAAGDTDVSE